MFIVKEKGLCLENIYPLESIKYTPGGRGSGLAEAGRLRRLFAEKFEDKPNTIQRQ